MSSHPCLSPLTFKVKRNLGWQIEASYSHLYCISDRTVPIYYDQDPLFCHFNHLPYREKISLLWETVKCGSVPFAKEVQTRGNCTVSTFSIMYFVYLQQALKRGIPVAKIFLCFSTFNSLLWLCGISGNCSGSLNHLCQPLANQSDLFKLLIATN